MGIGVIASLAILVPAQAFTAPTVDAGARPDCTGWNSTTQPPDYIRVLRNQSGRVDRVPFKKYVLTVLGKEWPGYLPQAVIQAGAVAVKQYAWFHALGNGRISRQGQCFDVTDGVGDQLYKPNKARIRQDHYIAVDATWGVRLTKGGSLFMTGYRTGNKGACGHDATGWKLFARSATRCAYSGDGYQEILRIYYGPVAVVNGGGNGSSSADGFSTIEFDTPAPSSTTDQAPVDTAAVSATCGISDGVGLGLPTDTNPVPMDSPIDSPVVNDNLLPIGERAFTAA